MKIGCKVGFHKWEILESKDKQGIETHIEDTLRGFPYMGYFSTTGPFMSKKYVEKVCLNCKKYINEIAPQYEKLEPKIKDKLKVINNIRRT
jgi:hypothetical protein